MKIPFSKPTIGREEIDAITRVMKPGWLAAGLETDQFEKEFAKYVGVKYAIFTNSGTSALKMAYKYFLGQGYNKYRCLDNTFCATYSSAEEMGLRREGYYVPEMKMIVGEEKCILTTVHYGGIKDETPCFIEDSAHRIEPNDPLVGEIRCYSFYVTKNMTAIHGGMLVTDDREIYEKCRLYWNDGIDNKYEVDYKVVEMAGGYDGNDVYAAVGRVQLRKLPEFNKRRQEIIDRYNEAFGKNWKGRLFYPYNKDKKMIDYLAGEGIGTKLYYPPDGFVCLPVYPLLTNKEIDYIIEKVREYESFNNR